MPFGPDNNLQMDFQKAATIKVNPEQTIRLVFSFQSRFENAICLYDRNLTKRLERGNYDRSDDAWEWTNDSNQIVEFIVSGWHKKSTPDGSKPWNQSLFKVVSISNSGNIIGFEDGLFTLGGNESPSDYNDAAVVISLSY
jgi:hypothetical protein